MKRERLKLALEKIRPEQWSLFEEFASEFLSSEYPNIRSTASSSGDRGRDAELFTYDGLIKTVLQYSVGKNWESKIIKTAKRVSEEFPETQVLIYVTNQSISSSGDRVKNRLRSEFEMILDIHDESWFLDRMIGDERRVAVSENLAIKIVDPFLSSKGVLDRTAPNLSTSEYRAAFTFLQLQWEDDTREKGLTKLSFEALVRMVLRNSNSESRISRESIHQEIISILPNHDINRLKNHINSALAKLDKRYIRHWRKEDEFCLKYDEYLRVKERLAEIEVANSVLDLEVEEVFMRNIEDPDNFDESIRTKIAEATRKVIGKYLSERGEVFAIAIANDELNNLNSDELDKSVRTIVEEEFSNLGLERRELISEGIISSIIELFSEPSNSVREHLRSMADVHTLLAFLGQTPDVQSAVSKLFSHGMIWLDTSIILPLLAEDLLPPESRRFSQMIKMTTDAGIEVKVTPGVVEEVERHLNRCSLFARMRHTQWSGRIPYLSNAYILSGRSLLSFHSWMETFVGSERAEEDLAIYLREVFSIELESLEDDELKASEQLRSAVQNVWFEIHTTRRSPRDPLMDEITVTRLVNHDVENYLGIVMRRNETRPSSLGYSAWWLTLDRSAFEVTGRIREILGRDTPATPVMSADFLVNYLSIGPIRAKIRNSESVALPLLLGTEVFYEIPTDLIQEAEGIRHEAGDLPENIIRRRVRDGLDSAKRRKGKVVEEGAQFVLDAIESDTKYD